MTGALAPLVVCLACGADDQRRRIEEVVALAEGLGGEVYAQEVTGRTTALSVRVPEAAGARFSAAMTLGGAIIAGADTPAERFIVLLTAESQT